MIEKYLLIWLFFGVICAVIASAKNKNVGKAFIAGAVFGFFALIYYIFCGREPKRNEVEDIKEDTKEEIHKLEKYVVDLKSKGLTDKQIYNKLLEKGLDKDTLDSLVTKKQEDEFICEYCEKKFKSENTLNKHYDGCEEKQYRQEKDTKILIWTMGIIVFIGFGIYFLISNKINLVPLLLIGLILTPFFDKIFGWYKKKNKKLKHFEFNWWKKAIFIGGIILLFILVNLIIPECPKSCDDNNLCTNDFCSTETSFKCMNTIKLNCNGNGICEAGEYGKSSDCPDCEDGNKCTADSYDTGLKQCIHVEMKGCTQ